MTIQTRYVRWTTDAPRPLVIVTRVDPSTWIALVDDRLRSRPTLARQLIEREVTRLSREGLFPGELSDVALRVEYYVAALRGDKAALNALMTELEHRGADTNARPYRTARPKQIPGLHFARMERCKETV